MSTIFDLDADGAAALEDEARRNPLRPEDVPLPAFSGTGEAVKGLLRPSAGAGRTLLLAGSSITQAIDKAALAGDWLGGRTQRREELGLGPADLGLTDWYFKNVVDEVGSTAVDHWTPNPETMGSAAKAMNVGGNVVGAIPQMFGMPGLFLANSAFDPSTELVRQGVDARTAGLVGSANLAANAIGLKLPAAWGTSLATRLSTGAGANLGLGVVADALSSSALERGGYDDQAEGFSVTDPYARALDVLMGAAFGWKAHVDVPKVLTPAQRDAVLTTRNNDHLHRQTLPGEPVDARAARAHADSLSEAISQVLRGEPVQVADQLRAEDFMLRPELQAAMARTAGPAAGFDAAVQRVLRDEGGFVDDAADRGGATNFGISSRAHPDVDVSKLTREQAVEIYRERYWDAIDADTLPQDLQGVAFDAAVNQGVGWTRRALAQADGDPAAFIRLREERYRSIVAADPSQARFLRGWLNRLGRYKETSPAGEALRERLVTDPEQLARDYAALEDSNGGTVLNTDTARELEPEYLADRTRSADVQEAASDTIKTIYEAKLAQPTPKGFDRTVLFTAGGTGAGKTTAIKDAGGAFGRPEITYDTNMNTLSSAVDKIERALAAGREVRIAYVYRDPVEALTGGAIPRAQRQAEEFGSGRTVPLEEHAKTHVGVRPVMEALAAKYQDDPRVSMVAIDNSRGKGNAELVDLETLPRVEEDSLRERLQEALDQARTAGLAEDLYRGFSAAGRPGEAAPRVGSGDGGQPQPQNRGEVSPAETPLQAAQRVAAESPDTQVIDGFDADGNPRYRSMAEALAEIEAERVRAANDASAYPAAVSCFLRRGG